MKSRKTKAFVGAVLVAAGLGKRLGVRGTRKALINLGGKPMLRWALDALLATPEIGELALVVHPQDLKVLANWASKQRFKKSIVVTVGGAERQDSVANGLAALAPGWRVLLVQDAARPFITSELVSECCRVAMTRGACLAVTRVKDSIKMISGSGLKSIPRERLLAAQTPQAARAELLLQAHAWAAKTGHLFTDEASLLEQRGIQSVPVMAYAENFKVTTPEDLELARTMIKRKRRRS